MAKPMAHNSAYLRMVDDRALFAVVPLLSLVAGMALEERDLKRDVHRYAEYTVRVPYRLVPPLW